MGKEHEAQIWGTNLGMAAVALLAAVTAITVALMVGGHVRSLVPDSATQGSGSQVVVLEYRSPE